MSNHHILDTPSLQKDASSLDSRDFCVLAGFLLFLVFYFAGVLTLPAERCLGRPEGDARNQFYGWRAYGFGEVRAGRFPLWNPYEFLGMPFVAALQSAMFYPPNWLCAVLPFGRAINLAIIIGLFLSGLFTYLWCRRVGLSWTGAIVAAAVYVFGAPQFLRIFEGHWSFLAPMSWIPCALWAVEIMVSGGPLLAAAVIGAVAVAMQLLGGNPQYAFYGGIAALLYFVGRLWQTCPPRGGRARSSGVNAVNRGEPALRLAGKPARGEKILRAVGSLVLMYVLGALLAGVQLLPGLELLFISSRKGQLSYQWVSQYSFVPENIITFLVPDFYGSDAGVQYWGRWNLWEMSAYCGVVAAGLALVGMIRGKRGLVVLTAFIAAVFFALALGPHAPLLKLMYRWVPGFDLFRAQARFLGPMSLFVALLAGLGADAIVGAVGSRAQAPADENGTGRRGAPPAAGRRGLRIALWVLGGLALLLVLGGIVLSSEWEFAKAGWTRFMQAMLKVGADQRQYLPYKPITGAFMLEAMRGAGMSLFRAGALIGVLALLGVFALRLRSGATVLALLLLGLVAEDAWSFGQRYLKTFDPREDGLTQGAIEFLNKKEPFRFARAGCFEFPPCEGMAHGFACLEGVQPNVPARFRDVFWTFQGRPKTTQTTVYSLLRLTPPLRMLNLHYLVQYRSSPIPQIEGLRTAYEDDRIRIGELPDPCPRAWLVHDYRVVPDSDEMLRLLRRWNYERAALFEEEPGFSVAPPPRAEQVEFSRYEPNRVDMKVLASSNAFLVFSDLHYPGWKATLDDQPVPILRANYLMRAVPIPAGRHDLKFRFEPASFAAGIAASLIGCLAVLLIVLRHVQRPRGGDAGSIIR